MPLGFGIGVFELLARRGEAGRLCGGVKFHVAVSGFGVPSRHDKPRERGGPKGSKLSIGTQWVSNPTRKRLATPGSEFCVVASNGGTKRKQLALKPCDSASK